MRTRALLLIAAPLTAVVVLSACSRQPAPPWSGYAEGETLYIAAPVAGRLQELGVQSGQQVAQDTALFALDATPLRAQDAEAAARAQSAQAQARDADKGRRPQEVAVSEAQLSQARTQAQLAATELNRRKQLLAQGFIAQAQVDDASLQARTAREKVSELEAALKTANLPAREDERASARALAAAAQSGQAQTDWQLKQSAQRAPAAGLITDVFFRPGEWVAAGQPVLSLLPPANRKARFFVPEADLAKLRLGQAVKLSCDGCGEPIAAHVSFVAPQAEYTPPVIYSNQQRSKLVFMVEARPDQPADAERLHPGQPLDVRP
ncbi:HlyD family secretion protein [Burkholderiaceae bacterium UC74_6]